MEVYLIEGVINTSLDLEPAGTNAMLMGLKINALTGQAKVEEYPP